MKVMQLTTASGVYYNADHSPKLIAATLERCPDWRSIKLVEMTEDEYHRIPATQEAAELWR